MVVHVPFCGGRRFRYWDRRRIGEAAVVDEEVQMLGA